MSFHEKFHIGAYYLQKNARTEEHIRDLALCGIDVLFGINCDRDTLDMLHRHGIGAVVNGVVPGWFGAHGEKAGEMHLTNPIGRYVEGAERFCDHPAILGIDIGDEPSALDFPHLGSVVDAIRPYFKDKLLYLNIYPSYGMLADSAPEQISKELGRASYRDYLLAYLSEVDLPYLSFDHYFLSSDKERFLSDLATASELCRERGKSLMTVLQVNSREADRFASLGDLRFQAFSAFAYGAMTVTWACYCAGWWHNNVLDSAGVRTEQYDKLKQVNTELGFFAERCKRAREGSPERIFAGLASKEGGVVSSVNALICPLEGGGFFYSPLSYESGAVELRLRSDSGRSPEIRVFDGELPVRKEADGSFTVTFSAAVPAIITCRN